MAESPMVQWALRLVCQRKTLACFTDAGEAPVALTAPPVFVPATDVATYVVGFHIENIRSIVSRAISTIADY